MRQKIELYEDRESFLEGADGLAKEGFFIHLMGDSNTLCTGIFGRKSIGTGKQILFVVYRKTS